MFVLVMQIGFWMGMIVNVIPPRKVEIEERGVEELTITAMTMTTAINSTTDAYKWTKTDDFGQVRTSAGTGRGERPRTEATEDWAAENWSSRGPELPRTRAAVDGSDRGLERLRTGAIKCWRRLAPESPAAEKPITKSAEGWSDRTTEQCAKGQATDAKRWSGQALEGAGSAKRSKLPGSPRNQSGGALKGLSAGETEIAEHWSRWKRLARGWLNAKSRRLSR